MLRMVGFSVALLAALPLVGSIVLEVTGLDPSLIWGVGLLAPALLTYAIFDL